MNATNTWHGWFDGAAEPNPGRMGIGAILVNPNGETFEISENKGTGTNNQAEYLAVIALLDLAIEHKVPDLLIYGDSQLVINQLNNEWGVKSENLWSLYQTAAKLIKDSPNVQLKWIQREANGLADALSKKALGIFDTAKLDDNWGTLTEAAKNTNLSAIKLGKILDTNKLRENNKATRKAIQLGIAAITYTTFAGESHEAAKWHKTKTGETLKELGLINTSHEPSTKDNDHTKITRKTLLTTLAKFKQFCHIDNGSCQTCKYNKHSSELLCFIYFATEK